MNEWYYITYKHTEIAVTISTTPLGPSFPAATWINFQCNASNGSGLYSYQWRVYCSVTGLLVYESELGSINSFRVKTTPPICYDKVVCVAEDTVLPASGTASITVTSVSGRSYGMVFLHLLGKLRISTIIPRCWHVCQ